MWHTSEGDRNLEGNEAKLFKNGITGLVEYEKEEGDLDGFGYSTAVFDNLTWSQRLAVLENAATHLLTKTNAIPKLTAVNEAAIAAIFEHISFEIDREIDLEPPRTDWRQLVLNTHLERFGQYVDGRSVIDGLIDEEESDESYIPESADSERRDLWHPLVQSLADQILWDRDFEMMEDFLDEPPEKAGMLRQIMGIDDDYFATAAEDLKSAEEIGRTLQRLDGILK